MDDEKLVLRAEHKIIDRCYVSFLKHHVIFGKIFYFRCFFDMAMSHKTTDF